MLLLLEPIQDVLLLMAVGMAEPLIMGAVHSAVQVVLAVAVGGLITLLAVVELLDKETLAEALVHLMEAVEEEQGLLVLTTLMAVLVLLLLFQEQ
jgi:hypothetical protein